MFCNKCGAKLENDAQFCSVCGKRVEIITPLKNTVEEKREKGSFKRHKVIISVLAILLILSAAFNIIQITTSDSVQGGDALDSEIKTEQNKHNNLVEKGIDALAVKWAEIYAKDNSTNGYLEIYHTRIFDITPDESDAFFQELDRGLEIDYIIEFSLYSDYFASSPYFHDAAVYDTVLVYKDGTTTVASNFFQMYSNLTYNYDYSRFLTEIDDLGANYNQIIRLE